MDHLPHVFQEIFNNWIPPKEPFFAHAFKRGKTYELHLSTTPNLSSTVRVEQCEDLRSLRKLAASLHAKPWNFEE